MKVVVPGDDHEGQIGTIYELLDDDSGVCVTFSGDTEPYAFGRDELEALPPAGNRPAPQLPRSNASGPQRSVTEWSTSNPTRWPPSPGWYPDPLNPGKRAYWDGTGWAEPVGVPSNLDTSKKTAVALGVSVLVVIGLVMSMQSVSLLSGSGPVWLGVGVVGAGTAVAIFMGAATWVRVVAAAILALSLMNGFYVENQLSEKRNEITQVFNK